MRRSSAGAALPETLITIAVSLALLFAVAQLTLLGYTQSTAEGAAFVAAHAAGINSTGSASSDQTYAQGVIAAPFPNVKSGDMTLTYPASSSTLQVVVAKNSTGIALSPNGLGLTNSAPPAPNVLGMDVEPIVNAGSVAPATTSLFGVQASLANYCGTTVATCVTNHPLYIAQYDVPTPTAMAVAVGNSRSGTAARRCFPAARAIQA